MTTAHHRPPPGKKPGARARWLAAGLLAASVLRAESILFIGNPTTTGEGSVLKDFHPGSVTELNGGTTGGIPALFKRFTLEAGLDYAVSAETAFRAGLDFHVTNKASLIARPWDHVVMHGFSTLDQTAPGSPGLLIKSAKAAVDLLRAKNPQVDLWLLATWPRADLVYSKDQHWSNKSVFDMTLDLRSAYDQAAASAGHVHGVIGVGDAWARAFKSGVADPNPYDGIKAGQLNLWSPDHYHASVYGYYLATLMVFGDVTGLDPRSLGRDEPSAAEIGITPAQAAALEKVAFEELTAGPSPRELKPFPRTAK